MMLTRFSRNIINKRSRLCDTYTCKKNSNYIRPTNAILFQIIPKADVDFCRTYSDSKTPRLPPISDAEPIFYPRFTTQLYNLYLMNFVLRLRVDKEFDQVQFLEGVKQAKVTVSQALARQDYESLASFVTDNAIQTVRSKIINLTEEQRELIKIYNEDMALSFIHSVKIFFANDQVDEEKTVEIMVVSQYMRNFQKKFTNPKNLLEQLENFKNNSMFCNYSFIRKYRSDTATDWIINAINHFTLDQ